MPIFHFNVHDGISIPDEDGHELPDLDAARREAIDLSGQLIREMGAAFWTGEEWRMDVTDHNGMILFSLAFFATIAPAGRSASAEMAAARARADGA